MLAGTCVWYQDFVLRISGQTLKVCSGQTVTSIVFASSTCGFGSLPLQKVPVASKIILFSQWGNHIFTEPGPFFPQTLLPWSHPLLLKLFSLPGAEEIAQLRKAYPADVRRPENLTCPLESQWKSDVVMLVSLSAGDADSWGGRAIYPSLIGERSFLLKWHLPEHQHLKLSSNLHAQMQSAWWHTDSWNIGRRKIHTSPFTRKGKRFPKKKQKSAKFKVVFKIPVHSVRLSWEWQWAQQIHDKPDALRQWFWEDMDTCAM